MTMTATTIPKAIAMRGPRAFGGASGGGEVSVVIEHHGPDASSARQQIAAYRGFRRVKAPPVRGVQSRENASASSFSTSSYGLPEKSMVTWAMVPPVNTNGAL